MGQWWGLHVSDGRRLRTWGKLGECLIDSSPGDLVQLLWKPELIAVPVPVYFWNCTQELADQQMTVLCPRLILEAPRRPPNPARTFPPFPTDILQHLFSLLLSEDDFLTMAMLCTTCSSYWTFGEIYLRRFIYNHQKGVLAGEKLTFLGDETETLPEGAFEESAGRKILGLEEVEERDEDEEGREWDDDGNIKQEDFSLAPYWGGWNPHVFRSEIYEPLHRFSWRHIKKPQEDATLVLTNLTTRQYVRARDVMVGGGRVGLGEALLMRICWSSCPRHHFDESQGLDRPEGFDIKQGIWCGHRFDVSSESSVNEEWEDVSKEVEKEINFVFSIDFGANWRDELGRSRW
ncbi:hypothetical protein MNV49_002741 [Pseudohyphozyma bogoriensis]|nr:hypothetical protein MNV49_002741 [Pseudohyphozyma bogoriensis]